MRDPCRVRLPARLAEITGRARRLQAGWLFTDKASGKDTQRPELERLLAFAREGYTVVVHSMDRLARNLDDLRLIVQKLTKRGVCIEFVKDNLTFTGEDSPLANLMLSVMGAFAEFERQGVGIAGGSGRTLHHQPAQVVACAAAPSGHDQHHRRYCQVEQNLPVLRKDSAGSETENQ